MTIDISIFNQDVTVDIAIPGGTAQRLTTKGLLNPIDIVNERDHRYLNIIHRRDHIYLNSLVRSDHVRYVGP
jgi:hypothetical protein